MSELEEFIKESEEITKIERARAINFTGLSRNNTWARRKGFEGYSDYKHKTGKCQSMSKNKNCALYLGVHIAERILSRVFEKVERMPYGNSGYDFICKNNFKIDVKSSCLYNNNQWLFSIKQNIVADYFLLLAFDSRSNLSPLHIWLIKGDEIIINQSGSMVLNKKTGLRISNSVYSLSKYNKYEQTDKLEKLIKCCDSIK